MVRRYWSGTRITKLEPNEVLTVGTNPEGRHGKGAAKAAMAFGARYGQGRGRMGQTYGLITKNLRAGFVEPLTDKCYPYAGEMSLSLWEIEENIQELYAYARQNPSLDFLIVYQYDPHERTSNLNGYWSSAMKDVFLRNDPPINIVFHESYRAR